MDTYFLKLSWKNIWRNKRRTILTVNAIAIGVMWLVSLYNYYDTFHEQVIQNAIRYKSGHLVVVAPGFEQRNAVGLYMKDPKKVDTWLSEREEVKRFSHRVLVQGFLSTAAGSATVSLFGIEPKRERFITAYSKNIIKGTYLSKKEAKNKPIVLGRELARILKVDVGSKIVALTQGVDGSIGNDLFFVQGIFDTHSEFDKAGAFIAIEDARVLLSMSKNAVHQTAIVLNSGEDIEKVKSGFEGAFMANGKKEVQLFSWMDLQKPLLAMIELNQGGNRLLMIIILFVASLGIANSVLMSILERTREFGVMLAIGTTKTELKLFVLTETLLLSLVGVALGNVFGIALTSYFGKYGFDLSWFTSKKIMIQGAIIQTVSYPTVQWKNSIMISCTILILTLLIAFIPIRLVSRLEPVKALRSL